MRKEDAAGTANVRCVWSVGMSLQSRIQVVVRGNPARINCSGDRLRSSEYITDTKASQYAA